MEHVPPIPPEPTSREPGPGSSGLPERFIPWIPIALALTLVLGVFAIFASLAPA